MLWYSMLCVVILLPDCMSLVLHVVSCDITMLYVVVLHVVCCDCVMILHVIVEEEEEERRSLRHLEQGPNIFAVANTVRIDSPVEW